MPQTRRAKRAGNTPLDRLQISIEGAESALKDLRREVGRDTRERLNDVGTTLKSARRNLTRTRVRIVKEMDGIERTLTKGKKRPASKRRAKPARAGTARSRKAATAKSTAKRKTASAKRKTASAKRTTASAKRKTASAKRKTASRSKAAAKPRAKRAAKKPAARKARAA
jgi:hypothetical protein